MAMLNNQKVKENRKVHIIWVNYNDLTATSLGMMVSKGNHPKIALIQGSEILEFTQIT